MQGGTVHLPATYAATACTQYQATGVPLVTAHVQLVTVHVQLVTPHVQFVTAHVQLVTAHVQLVTPHAHCRRCATCWSPPFSFAVERLPGLHDFDTLAVAMATDYAVPPVAMTTIATVTAIAQTCSKAIMQCRVH